MAELDDIIHQPLRLRIMAALNALPAANGLEFSKLKKLTGATDGNLGAHIETLVEGRLCRGRQGLCRQEAADHGDRDRGRARRVRAACGVFEGDHRGGGGAAKPSSERHLAQPGIHDRDRRLRIRRAARPGMTSSVRKPFHSLVSRAPVR